MASTSRISWKAPMEIDPYSELGVYHFVKIMRILEEKKGKAWVPTRYEAMYDHSCPYPGLTDAEHLGCQMLEWELFREEMRTGIVYTGEHSLRLRMLMKLEEEEAEELALAQHNFEVVLQPFFQARQDRDKWLFENWAMDLSEDCVGVQCFRTKY